MPDTRRKPSTGERLLRYAWAIGLGGVMMSACAPTLNLPDPAGPKFEGRFAPASPDDGAASLKVVTFNIKLGRQIDKAAAVLQAGDLRGADVIAVQEVDQTGAARLAQALRMNYVYYPGVVHPTDHRYFGPAILTRWPIERSWKLTLPHLGRFRHQQRTATAAIIRYHGLPVRVYAVHFEAQLRLTAAQRADQVRAVLDDARRMAGPVVIAGDFNSYDIGPVLTRAGYLWLSERTGPSISMFSWDHIFAAGFTPAGSRSSGVAGDTHGASDHHPVWAVMRPVPAALAGGVSSAP
jgi:endonuclease/exonuclease/phosphatase family metal-dependent hydrolase